MNYNFSQLKLISLNSYQFSGGNDIENLAKSYENYKETYKKSNRFPIISDLLHGRELSEAFLNVADNLHSSYGRADNQYKAINAYLDKKGVSKNARIRKKVGIAYKNRLYKLDKVSKDAKETN